MQLNASVADIKMVELNKYAMLMCFQCDSKWEMKMFEADDVIKWRKIQLYAVQVEFSDRVFR